MAVEPQERIEIRFEDLSLAEAGTKAQSLRRELTQNFPDLVSANIAKDDPSNQDFGATLILLLGTPAVIAIAEGIASYLKRQRGKITISKDGAVVAEGISGNDAARIAEAMAGRKK
jgi:hypothetical protein